MQFVMSISSIKNYKHLFKLEKENLLLCGLNSTQYKKGGFHLYLFPFWISFYLHFKLVTSIIALDPNTVELEWQLKWLNLVSSDVSSLYLKRDRIRRCFFK